MKIRILAIIFAFIMLLSLASCGEKKPIVIDIEAISGDIAEIYEGTDIELTPIDEEAINIHYGLNGLYNKIYVEGSVTVTSDEFLIMEAVDEEGAKKAYELLEAYRKERISLFSSYASEQVPKLEEALLECEGRYVIFVVSENASAAEKIWKEYRG